MINQELVKKVRGYFDLNIYETKVWLALISKGIASAGEVAEMSGVPRSRTYDVLESLEKRGYAIAKIGKPVRYMAVKPTLVIEKLKNKTMIDAKDRVNQLASLKDTTEYDELTELYNQSFNPVKQDEVSGAVKGKNNIFSHVREMLENAEKSVVICTHVDDLENKSRIFSPLFERLEKNGIKMKIVLSGDENKIKKTAKKFNIKPKRLDINGRFFISDNKQILFMLSSNQNESQDIGIWINSQFFVGSLLSMFNMVYSNGK